jgi:LAO/AO transport system kinase
VKEKDVNNWVNKKKARRDSLSADTIFEGISKGEIGALSSGITIIESQRKEDRDMAATLLELCLPISGNSMRIGVTGVPGVGKSTFIEAFGAELTKKGKRVAVLAVDPTSAISGGSILGDKTRMQNLSVNPDVFIRPSPTGSTLGGTARSTRESIILCEAAGFDIILIETVGVGQSETAVKSMVDFFLLLMLAGAGDELQGIKKGIMEMADALVITKADGDNAKLSKNAIAEYKNALHLFPPNQNNWIVPVFSCSSIEGTNIDKVKEVVDSFQNQMNINGWLAMNRQEQELKWMKDSVNAMILDEFYESDKLMSEMNSLEDQIKKGEIPFYKAAAQLFEMYKQERND